MRSVHIDTRVQKYIQSLERCGKKAGMAAQRAEMVIERLLDGDREVDDVAAMTRHGELRLKGCMKYDLGSGYRLITLKQGKELFVLYCGTHDDCHRWIENNRELHLDPVRQRSRTYRVGLKDTPVSASDRRSPGEIDEEDDDYESDIDEKLLRSIFCGLAGDGDDSDC